ncbi:hypothetical protein WH47_11365 [Habropoda laboriosa]|uniref:Uncharacterized protein n=1 Tax=Habropoda laboriosa TaxID=597456 RepID=A0A0L7QLU5_9HYME|nr:PREDICTED: uncharacterized protein LOC108577521 [Habropoda laboriosa]KOC59623.1 hypothetical protein WH47_11365 [Habropoda laboriosa]
MHFWINKPAGRYYGFTDRRYPATPLPKTRLNRCQYNADLRQMVTPLRFQTLNAMENAAGPSNVNNCRVIQTTIRTNNETQNSFPVGSTQHPQLNNISNNVTTAGNNQLILSNSTSNRTNRSLLDFPEINDAERTSCRVRAVLSIFMVTTAFVTAAIKFYFGDGFLDKEIFVFWGLLILLLNACLYPILCCRNQRNNHQEHQIQEEHIASITAANTMPNENIRPISVVSHNPPPPYHIAILIPPHNSSDEAPPPSYDKVMR